MNDFVILCSLASVPMASGRLGVRIPLSPPGVSIGSTPIDYVLFSSGGSGNW